ncbi:MAG TPA: acyl-CoA dehydrogenase family protein, partial [Solirubrobacteraceae bacterium]
MTTTSTTSTLAATDLSDEHVALQQRAREYVERVLRPLELTAEAAGGRLPEETVEHIKREAIAARLQGGRVPAELGGQGWSMYEWFLVNEQFGRVTN